MSLNFITVGILVLSLPVSSAFGQCPPVSDGKMPQSEKIAQIILPTKKVFNSFAIVPSDVLMPVELTKQPRFIADSAVLFSAKRSTSTMQKNFVANKGVSFSGPISIQVPGPGTKSKIVEQDGRFIIVGASDTFNGQENEQGLFLARFEADGTPDPTFGQGGSTRIILFAQNHISNNLSPSVALTPDKKIVVVRSIVDIFPSCGDGTRVVVIRMDHDGSLDPTFGNGGFVFTTIKNKFDAGSIAVQRDGKVVVVGSSGQRNTCGDELTAMFATLVRYQSNGQLDPTFGNGGVVRSIWLVGQPALISMESNFSSLFIQENGLIVAAGTIETGEFGATSEMLIAEYLPTGELNPVFGSNGATMLTFDGPYQNFGASSLVVRENGRILAGGNAFLYQGNSAGSTLFDQAFVFAQFTPSGELDATFANTGKVVVNVNPRPGSSPLRPLDDLVKVMLDSKGDIYAAGMASAPGGKSEYAIDFVALNSDGSLKKNFGKGGMYSFGTYIPWHIEIADDALLTSDGRLVISGTHWPDHHNPDAFVLWAFSIKPGVAGCPLSPR